MHVDVSESAFPNEVLAVSFRVWQCVHVSVCLSKSFAYPNDDVPTMIWLKDSPALAEFPIISHL